MIIAIAGIKRSGSTVQFNLVRIALEMAGYTVNVCGHGYKPREVPEGEVDLVKRHPFSKEIAEAADHIFLTDRKDEEVLASLERFNGNKPHPSRIQDMRRHLDKWKEHDHLMLEFDIWQMDEFMYIHAILNYLGYDIYKKCSAVELLERFNQIEPPATGQDKKTLLFSNHITSCE